MNRAPEVTYSRAPLARTGESMGYLTYERIADRARVVTLIDVPIVHGHRGLGVLYSVREVHRQMLRQGVTEVLVQLDPGLSFVSSPRYAKHRNRFLEPVGRSPVCAPRDPGMAAMLEPYVKFGELWPTYRIKATLKNQLLHLVRPAVPVAAVGAAAAASASAAPAPRPTRAQVRGQVEELLQRSARSIDPWLQLAAERAKLEQLPRTTPGQESQYQSGLKALNERTAKLESAEVFQDTTRDLHTLLSGAAEVIGGRAGARLGRMAKGGLVAATGAAAYMAPAGAATSASLLAPIMPPALIAVGLLMMASALMESDDDEDGIGKLLQAHYQALSRQIAELTALTRTGFELTCQKMDLLQRTVIEGTRHLDRAITDVRLSSHSSLSRIEADMQQLTRLAAPMLKELATQPFREACAAIDAYPDRFGPLTSMDPKEFAHPAEAMENSLLGISPFSHVNGLLLTGDFSPRQISLALTSLPPEALLGYLVTYANRMGWTQLDPEPLPHVDMFTLGLRRYAALREAATLPTYDVHNKQLTRIVQIGTQTITTVRALQRNEQLFTGLLQQYKAAHKTVQEQCNRAPHPAQRGAVPERGHRSRPHQRLGRKINAGTGLE